MAVVLVLFGLSLALALLFAMELALRIAYPEKVLAIAEERTKVQSLPYVFHPEYLVVLKPNVAKTYRRDRDNGGESIDWETNSDGFRGKPLRAHPPVRIMVYGDSNIQAPFSRLENTYPYKLGQYLTQLSGTDIEVINAGIVGSGPDQSLMRFAGQFDRYKPDLVVFAVFADNDFGDIIRNRIFTLNAQGELVRTGFRATIDDELRGKLPRLLLVSAAQAMTHLLSDVVGTPASSDRASAQAPVGADTGQDAVFKKLIDVTEAEYAIYKKGEPRAFSHFADHYDIDLAVHPTAESSRVKIALMNGVLQEVKNTAQAKGTNLLVLIEPSDIDITHDNDRITSAYLSRFDEYRRERLTSIVDDICTQNHIDHINLFPIFARSNPDTLYFKSGDTHWNDAGQDLAARESAKYIAGRFPKVLGLDSSPGYVDLR
jgi:hypothetical protein